LTGYHSFHWSEVSNQSHFLKATAYYQQGRKNDLRESQCENTSVSILLSLERDSTVSEIGPVRPGKHFARSNFTDAGTQFDFRDEQQETAPSSIRPVLSAVRKSVILGSPDWKLSMRICPLLRKFAPSSPLLGYFALPIFGPFCRPDRKSFTNLAGRFCVADFFPRFPFLFF
jgi:hypothetical protein